MGHRAGGGRARSGAEPTHPWLSPGASSRVAGKLEIPAHLPPGTCRVPVHWGAADVTGLEPTGNYDLVLELIDPAGMLIESLAVVPFSLLP